MLDVVIAFATLDDVPADAGTQAEIHVQHPHRQPLRPARTRRAGAVQDRPQICSSPIAGARGHGLAEHSAPRLASTR